MANNRVKSTNDLELKDRLVAINRVTKVTKGGRTFSFAAIVVVGNEDGIVGWGLGKAGEVTTAIAKGVEAAKKNLIKVPVHKGTIPHEQLAKFGGAQVLIRPASHGTGVKAGGAMRAVLESATTFMFCIGIGINTFASFFSEFLKSFPCLLGSFEIVNRVCVSLSQGVVGNALYFFPVTL